MFFAGYVATVSFCDRADRSRRRAPRVPRRRPAAALGSAGFGFAADGFCERGAVPGADRRRHRRPPTCRACACSRIASRAPARARYIAFYTSFFGIGTALSLSWRARSRRRLGWRGAFLGSRARAGAGRACWCLPSGRSQAGLAAKTAFSLKLLFPVAAWRKVLADRAARGLHVRLCGALPGAVRFAGVDGGVPRLFRERAIRAQASPGTPRPSPQWST